ncbi:MAG TPA: hypothetical protein QGF95_21235 [Candidatus Latescibacteria bacterium]|nr:hypothetical protein [Candidatus Latescibacterota bacterium]
MDTEHYMTGHKGYGGRGMTLATAMAISGAAANPNTGVAGGGLMRNRLVSLLMSLLNVRLGYWGSNPRLKMRGRPNYIVPGLRGVLGLGLNEEKRAVELTDGGHFENLGIYELVRRQAKLIIVSDGACDFEFGFGDLANATERVRADFGAEIRFDNDRYGLEGLIPGSAGEGTQAEKYKLAQRGFAVGTITYRDADPGTLLYIKSTLTPGLSPDLYGYRSANPTFPDQTTADQWFDEAQFEAYRELGEQLGEQLLAENEKFGGAWV